jgi:hypothetical protein
VNILKRINKYYKGLTKKEFKNQRKNKKEDKTKPTNYNRVCIH